MRSRLFYRYKILFIAVVCALCILSSGFSEPFQTRASYQVCFTPQHNCTAKIVQSIDHAQSSIHVQAYSFTSKPIIYALLNAKKRGIEVNVILDKSHLARPEHGYQLLRVGIPVWIDHPTGIAHNKVMVIDKTTVITGSFNFSYSAQYKNHENVLFVSDRTLARRYLNNWKACQMQSSRLMCRGKTLKATRDSSDVSPIWKVSGILGAFAALWAIFGPL